MAPVLAPAKTTASRLPEGSRERANLAVVLQAGERARGVVRQILAFSRKEMPTRQPLDVAALVRAALNLLAASLPSRPQPLTSANPNAPDRALGKLRVGPN
jgi:signal transduction histidine kinase